MPFANSQGAKIYWEQHGSGPPVLLIMGLSFTHEMWFRVLPSLSDSYHAILFDNRGMGRSDVPRGPYRIGQMAADAVAVMDAAGISAAHIVGASMGGMIAQELALRYPRRVLSLLLGCTSYGGLFARWPDFTRRPRNLRWDKSTRPEREAALVPLLYADSTSPERIAEDLQVRCQCIWTYKGFWNQFAGILLWNSYRRLPRIRVPTLVVHGDQDRLVPPQNGRVVAARIPQARFQLIANAGHILTTDQPEACVETIRQFLGQQLAIPQQPLYR
jgi:pimeloyl-ACP methyl ester carboxylesterase